MWMAGMPVFSECLQTSPKGPSEHTLSVCDGPKVTQLDSMTEVGIHTQVAQCPSPSLYPLHGMDFILWVFSLKCKGKTETCGISVFLQWLYLFSLCFSFPWLVCCRIPFCTLLPPLLHTHSIPVTTTRESHSESHFSNSDEVSGLRKVGFCLGMDCKSKRILRYWDWVGMSQHTRHKRMIWWPIVWFDCGESASPALYMPGWENTLELYVSHSVFGGRMKYKIKQNWRLYELY